MNTIELFCGTKSFSKVAKSLGHYTFTIDNDSSFDPDYCEDVLNLNLDGLKKFDVVWMSPPCQTFSLASGGKHWDKFRNAKTKDAEIGKSLLLKCKEIADFCIENNKVFFIENPNGRAVWFLPDRWLKKVWYCQYGDERAKPTNIWTNLNIKFKTCKNNNPNCNHIRAKRGSKTGTQGLKNAKNRSRIPEALFYEIFENIKREDGN